MKVSVVVPCYKKSDFLPECLDSVLAQTFCEGECIVVNDGSPDNTEEVALRYCQIDPRFHYLAQPNQGVSAARNKGIRQMRGEFVLALDADDWISPSYLEKAVSYLERHPDVKLVYSRCEVFDSSSSRMMDDYSYEKMVMGDIAIVCSAIYRRVDFDRVGGYDEDFMGYEDWDLWLRILDKGDTVHRIDEVLFHYRKDSSIVSSHVAQNVRLLRSKLCKKHKTIYQPLYADILFYYGVSREYESLLEELHRTQKVYSSWAYRLGKMLLRPMSWLKIKHSAKK